MGTPGLAAQEDSPDIRAAVLRPSFIFHVVE